MRPGHCKMHGWTLVHRHVSTGQNARDWGDQVQGWVCGARQVARWPHPRENYTLPVSYFFECNKIGRKGQVYNIIKEKGKTISISAI